LKTWKTESLATGDEDLIFYGKDTTKSIDRGTILDNFKKGLERAKIKGGKNLVPPLPPTYFQFLYAGGAAFRGGTKVYRSQH
jgi:hypothetical protein